MEVVLPVKVKFVGTVGGWVSTTFDTVRTRVAEPVPPLFVALIVTFVVAATVGVPEMRPDEVLTESPAGRPVALKLVGLFEPAIW